MLQAEAFDASTHNGVTRPDESFPFTLTTDMSSQYRGGHVSGRWSRALADGGDLALQAFYDRVDIQSVLLDVKHDIFDLEFQQRIPTTPRNEVVWGLGYRRTELSSDGTDSLSFDPAERGDDLYSGFVQDELTLVPERLKVTIGSKLEENDTSGFEVQPTARFVWTPRASQTIWGAVSRAVSTPSPADTDLRLRSAF